MGEEMQTGGCLCGTVRYAAGVPLYAPTLCHCTSCRRAAGAHAVAWLTVRREDLVFTATRPLEYRSSPGVVRGFCARCGTPLTYRHDSRPAEVDVTLATLDAPGGLEPLDHIYMADALHWDRPGDGRPEHPGTRPVAEPRVPKA
jgi:hypothetical protein